MSDYLYYLTSGFVFGLVAGISPGPLFTLLVAETVKFSRKAGIKVAFAPLITDTPIVLLSVLVLTTLPLTDTVLGMISLLGAGFIVLLALENIRIKGLQVNPDQVASKSLRKAIITNFLNPHPYVFWITVGTPILIKASEINTYPAILFVVGFYVVMILSKIIIALLVDKSKALINGSAFLWIVRILGIILLLFAFMFLKDGLVYLNVI